MVTMYRGQLIRREMFPSVAAWIERSWCAAVSDKPAKKGFKANVHYLHDYSPHFVYGH